MEKHDEKEVCEICKKKYEKHEGVFGYNIFGEVLALIKEDYPNWMDNSFICNSDLKKYRQEYMEKLLKDEKDYAESEKEVLNSILDKTVLSKNIHEKSSKQRIFGQKVADGMAKFGGSWSFLFIFVIFIVVWVCINTFLLLKKPFDPYPFILLNLFLSCIAAIQAPIIMMSQNRQEEKDRLRAENDYQINLKSEIEIKILHDKLDHLITDQWNRIVEIQNIQIELLESLQEDIKNMKNKDKK